MLPSIMLGFGHSAKLCLASGCSFFVASAFPEESLIKSASSVTGWVLALACIWVLSKTVKALFVRLEAKDAYILSLVQKQLDEQKAEHRHDP